MLFLGAHCDLTTAAFLELRKRILAVVTHGALFALLG